MTVYKDEDFGIRQTVQRSDGYPCVEIVPPGSMAIFEMTAGHAIALAARLEAAAKHAMGLDVVSNVLSNPADLEAMAREYPKANG